MIEFLGLEAQISIGLRPVTCLREFVSLVLNLCFRFLRKMQQILMLRLLGSLALLFMLGGFNERRFGLEHSKSKRF
ncbi:hypothetical protein EA796_19720 [Pseudomonas sp. AOB-7]|nr:hypothetical protein EA796_19720 [Pseudomonas sp. AOB-7]